jgi:hypothetical protein
MVGIPACPASSFPGSGQGGNNERVITRLIQILTVDVGVKNEGSHEGVLPICQNSHDRHSARGPDSVGRNAPNFSPKYSRNEPDSKTRIGAHESPHFHMA